jgi:hypothetical protein|tara:strand:- start:371 stop:514 length:144 start_codon:yes stop_codon:yes gene_type:complete
VKVRVTLWVAGSTFTDDVIVSRFQDASKVALQRNPQAKVINRKIIIE